MKVIDLLNKIANGEEIPETIIIKNRVFEKYGNHNTYIDKEDNYFHTMTRYYNNDKDFYNEKIAEVIAEEPKKIEKVSILTMSKGLMNLTENERILLQYINRNSNKLNEIIDYINNKENNE